MRRSDDEELDDYDPEAPDESDMDSSDEPDFVECPECGKSISDDAERCHHCGCFVLDRRPDNRKPWWILIAAAVVVLAFFVIALSGVLG